MMQRTGVYDSSSIDTVADKAYSTQIQSSYNSELRSGRTVALRYDRGDHLGWGAVVGGALGLGAGVALGIFPLGLLVLGAIVGGAYGALWDEPSLARFKSYSKRLSSLRGKDSNLAKYYSRAIEYIEEAMADGCESLDEVRNYVMKRFSGSGVDENKLEKVVKELKQDSSDETETEKDETETKTHDKSNYRSKPEDKDSKDKDSKQKEQDGEEDQTSDDEPED